MDWKTIIDGEWTLFLDRDGVINVRLVDDYVKKIDEFLFMPNVIDALKIFNKRFRHIIIVTNQQGVGKGLMNASDVEDVHEYMIKSIENQGGRVDKVYFCPQLKSVPDNFRKPSPKMAYFAKNDFPDIDFSKSIMIGDMNSDIEFGKNAGMKTILVGNESIRLTPDDRFASLYEFAKII